MGVPVNNDSFTAIAVNNDSFTGTAAPVNNDLFTASAVNNDSFAGTERALRATQEVRTTGARPLQSPKCRGALSHN